jgi:hypothetical protein
LCIRVMLYCRSTRRSCRSRSTSSSSSSSSSRDAIWLKHDPFWGINHFKPQVQYFDWLCHFYTASLQFVKPHLGSIMLLPRKIPFFNWINHDKTPCWSVKSDWFISNFRYLKLETIMSYGFLWFNDAWWFNMVRNTSAPGLSWAPCAPCSPRKGLCPIPVF